MQASQPRTRDTMIASASVQSTPRVSIVLSSYKGGGDHFGNAKFTGVAEPAPPSAELSPAQISALTRRAIELGNFPNSDLRRVIGKDESVVLLVNRHADSNVVSTVIGMLKENKAGNRITVVTDAPRKFGSDVVLDISSAETVQMPAPGVWSRRDVTYRIPKILIDCDRLISIAPLQMEGGRLSLTIDNYRTLVRGSNDSKEALDVTALDLFGFHPAEFAVLGGPWLIRDGKQIRHNLVLAGSVAPAVDTIGAAILNVKPQAVGLLQTANERGLGESKPGSIWTLGNEIKDARAAS